MAFIGDGFQLVNSARITNFAGAKVMAVVQKRISWQVAAHRTLKFAGRLNPSPVTFKGLVEEHCRMIKIDVEQFGGWRRFWWEINGTRFGIWLQNYRTTRSLYAYKANPEFEAWSKPLPESLWARPSAELDYYNGMLETHDYSDGLNILAVSDLRERFGSYPPQAKGVEGKASESQSTDNECSARNGC